MEIPVHVAAPMAASQSDHYHDAGGALVPGPGSSPHYPVASQLTPADREAASIAGTPPPVITDERMPVLNWP
jgi:hypothetical protein